MGRCERGRLPWRPSSGAASGLRSRTSGHSPASSPWWWASRNPIIQPTWSPIAIRWAPLGVGRRRERIDGAAEVTSQRVVDDAHHPRVGRRISDSCHRLLPSSRPQQTADRVRQPVLVARRAPARPVHQQLVDLHAQHGPQPVAVGVGDRPPGDEARALVDVHAAPLLALRQPLRQLGVARRRLAQGPADPGGALMDLTDQPRRGTLPAPTAGPDRAPRTPAVPRAGSAAMSPTTATSMRGEQQLRLRPEVRIHGLHRDARDASDISHPRPRPPVLAEEPDGGVEHRRPRLRRVLQPGAAIRNGVESGCARIGLR